MCTTADMALSGAAHEGLTCNNAWWQKTKLNEPMASNGAAPLRPDTTQLIKILL